jgi:hypothetical protein
VVLWAPWRMACACGAAACRGEARPWGALPPATRARYPRPLFAWAEEGRLPRGLPPWLARPLRARLAGLSP